MTKFCDLVNSKLCLKYSLVQGIRNKIITAASNIRAMSLGCKPANQKTGRNKKSHEAVFKLCLNSLCVFFNVELRNYCEGKIGNIE